MSNYGQLTGKVLEILGSGFILSLSKSKKQRSKLHKKCDKLWSEIDRKQLYHILRRLKANNLIKTIKKNNEKTIQLTQAGKKRWLEYQFNDLFLNKKKKWDKKWRIVVFDIPESKRPARDSLRIKLKKLGFLEFQKSIFIYPFPCQNEINFIINFFNIEEFVYYLKSEISPDFNFRKHFKI